MTLRHLNRVHLEVLALPAAPAAAVKGAATGIPSKCVSA